MKMPDGVINKIGLRGGTWKCYRVAEKQKWRDCEVTEMPRGKTELQKNDGMLPSSGITEMAG